MSKNIDKRFPADTSLDFLTFLNDKKLDEALYSYLQSMSYGKEGVGTVVYKNSLPPQSEICKKIRVKSPKTLRAHFGYLIERGYVIEQEEYYILPNQERMFFMIPLETLEFLLDNLQDHVVKIYIYLGQRYKFKEKQGDGQKYSFTIEELGEHLGINTKSNDKVQNALKCLMLLGLLGYEDYYDNQRPRKRLTYFSIKMKELSR